MSEVIFDPRFYAAKRRNKNTTIIKTLVAAGLGAKREVLFGAFIQYLSCIISFDFSFHPFLVLSFLLLSMIPP
jgi:hypothetical protein